MTSPFPPFTGSSPFPFPFPSISPFPLNTPIPNPTTTNPSNVPNPFGSSPFNFNLANGNPPSASAQTPIFPHTLSNLSFSTLPNPNTLSLDAQTSKRDENAEDLGKSLTDLSTLIDRAMNALREIQRLQSGLWTNGDNRGEGLEMTMAGVTKLELLNFEYNQTLSALLLLSQSSLVGALPVPLSSAAPTPTAPSDPTSISTPTTPTIHDLGVWAEQRANIEFQRREAIKSGSKAVLDVLRQQQVR